MSDEVPQSTPGERSDGPYSVTPRVSFDKEPERTAPAARGADGARVQDAAPAPGPVHDQQTVTSRPAFPGPATPADAVPAPWAAPAEGPTSRVPAPQPNPFAPPAATAQPNPFAPPAPAPQPNPLAPPPHSYSPPANPFAPPPPPAGAHGGAEPVPPPPIAPDGPGQVPYGYPGAAPAYGYPGAGPAYGYPGPQQAPYGGVAPYPAAHGYAWPGMQPPPSNGMGTASLVLGIVSTVGFVLWPIALAMSILALILGGLGRRKANRGEATNPGVALAGIICGAAGIVLVLVLFAAFIATGV
ncbi:DUF4190 domain-containing protein [Streptomyces sp. NPDC047841]|uniref:DUF4190 domain-containing protein n=1 Tax=Streptomyces sp. NPDC047841 TaxID=3154708 RepID=UPI003451F5FD